MWVIYFFFFSKISLTVCLTTGLLVKVQCVMCHLNCDKAFPPSYLDLNMRLQSLQIAVTALMQQKFNSTQLFILKN